MLALSGCDGKADEGSRPPPPPPTTQTFTVSEVVDGDTIRLTNGERVRLVQIDAPEVNDGECYGDQARAELRALLPRGRRVRLELDASLDQVDPYGRRLAYVFAGSTNVNVTLVRRGAARIFFFHGQRGRYADRLLTAAREARNDGLGLWSACARTPQGAAGSRSASSA